MEYFQGPKTKNKYPVMSCTNILLVGSSASSRCDKSVHMEGPSGVFGEGILSFILIVSAGG